MWHSKTLEYCRVNVTRLLGLSNKVQKVHVDDWVKSSDGR